MSRITSLYLLIFLLTILVVKIHGENKGVFDKIKVGLQYATNYLETAKDIADLVSKSLGKEHKIKRADDNPDKNQDKFAPPNVLSAFFRLFGLDSQKIAAIAVNSVIFLAQMISSLFDLTPAQSNNIESKTEDEPTWDPLKFIMENKNERVQNLIQQAHDKRLPDQLINRMDGFDSSCIRLLLCKTSPIIWAAQSSLQNRTQGGVRQMTAWLPSRDEFETNADKCEEKHTDCNIFPES